MRLSVSLAAPVVLIIVTFVVYTAMGNALDLGKAFATLSFFNFMQTPLAIMPRLLAVVADILNSARKSSYPRGKRTCADKQSE